MNKIELKRILYTENYITIPELKGIANKFGIEVPNRLVKKQVIELLVDGASEDQVLTELELLGKEIETGDGGDNTELEAVDSQTVSWSRSEKLKLWHIITIAIGIIAPILVTIYLFNREAEDKAGSDTKETTEVVQSIVLTGKVYTIFNDPIDKASVNINDLPLIYTDSLGIFKLSVLPKFQKSNYTIEVSKSGFWSKRRLIEPDSPFIVLLEEKQ